MNSDQFMEKSADIVRKYIFEHDDQQNCGIPLFINVEQQSEILGYRKLVFSTNFNDLSYECVLDGEEGDINLYVYKLIDSVD